MRLSTIGSHLAKWEKMFSVKKGSKIGRKLLRSSQLMKVFSISHGSQGEMDGQRKAYNWKSVMFTNVASSKDKKSWFSVSIEGSTISCSPGNCILRPH